MAIIKCPECEKDVSDKAESCPNCGYGIARHFREIEDENKKQQEKENAERRKNEEIEQRMNSVKLP